MPDFVEYQSRYVTRLIHDHASDLHYPHRMAVGTEQLQHFGHLIKEARERLGWGQEDLAEAADVSRPTINRYEQAKTGSPDPETARKIFRALRLDPRRIPVILGYVTEDEMGLPPEPARVFSASVEEVIAILEDPTVDPGVKAEWVEYLRHRRNQLVHRRGNRATG